MRSGPSSLADSDEGGTRWYFPRCCPPRSTAARWPRQGSSRAPLSHRLRGRTPRGNESDTRSACSCSNEPTGGSFARHLRPPSRYPSSYCCRKKTEGKGHRRTLRRARLARAATIHVSPKLLDASATKEEAPRVPDQLTRSATSQTNPLGSTALSNHQGDPPRRGRCCLSLLASLEGTNGIVGA